MNETAANKQVVLDLQCVWRESQLDELSRFWTVDCVNHADPGPDRIGLSPLRRYHEEFAAWFGNFDRIEIAVEQQVAEGGRVVTQMGTRAVHRASGRAVSFGSDRIDRLVDGRIAEHWSVADVAGLERQLR